MRGLPSARVQQRWMSSGSPCEPGLEAGRGQQVVDAHRQLRCGPSPGRSSRGRRRRPCRTAASASAGSARRGRGSAPLRHAASRMAESRMCSRLLIGSASMPSSPSRPATAEPTRSLQRGRRRRRSRRSGAANERSIDSGRPALRARRVDRDVGRVAQALRCARRPGPTPRGPCCQVVGGRGRELVDATGPCARPRPRRPRARSPRAAAPGRSAAGCRCRPSGR